jgi:hypothetical protein
MSTDLGNHVGTITRGSRTYFTKNLGILHFKVRGLPHYITKTAKAKEAFNFTKKGSNSVCGRHWRKDYDSLKIHGAEEGFTNLYMNKLKFLELRFDYRKFSFFE